jgi:hypothetical protein
MKVKAVKSFGGLISMYAGEIKDIEDKTILDDLVSAGYVESAEPKKKTKGKKK